MIHLNKIENLDCFTYGRYRIKISLYKIQTVNQKIQKNYLMPYIIPQCPYERPKNSNELENCHISESQEFVSSVFLIKNTNQNLEINEMCVFKFEDQKQQKQEDYQMEISIWRYAGSMFNYDQIQLDHMGYEMQYERNFRIVTLNRNINQFLPVFFSPHRTALLHLRFYSFIIQYKFDNYDANKNEVDFRMYLQKITKNFEKKELKKLNYLFNISLLNSIKDIFEKCSILLDNYYQHRVKLLKKQLGAEFNEIEANNRYKIFTNRDELLKNCLVQFKKNLKVKIFREMVTISKEEQQKRQIEFDLLKEQYENYDFLDLEMKEILVMAEMFDFSDLFQEDQLVEIDQIIFNVSQQVNQYQVINHIFCLVLLS